MTKNIIESKNAKIVSPIICQGSKLKLIPYIRLLSSSVKYDRWVEPFLGSGNVVFNLQPQKALLADNNPHIINFYKSLQSNTLTSEMVEEYLFSQKEKINKNKNNHYLEVRERFNQTFNILDFLFLNIFCFNRLMRFNSKGKFNSPWNQKPSSLSSQFISKTVNSIKEIQKIIHSNDFTFKCQDYQITLQETNKDDLVYCDPPYYGRHSTYYTKWEKENNQKFFEILKNAPYKFIISNWLNDDLLNLLKDWKNYFIYVKKHKYAFHSNPNVYSINEIFIINFSFNNTEQLSLSLYK